MIIDASIIENGITPEILQKLIYENERSGRGSSGILIIMWAIMLLKTA